MLVYIVEIAPSFYTLFISKSIFYASALAIVVYCCILARCFLHVLSEMDRITDDFTSQ